MIARPHAHPHLVSFFMLGCLISWFFPFYLCVYIYRDNKYGFSLFIYVFIYRDNKYKKVYFVYFLNKVLVVNIVLGV
jgi:hypothetical protein